MKRRARLLPRLCLAMLACVPAPLLAVPSPEQAALVERLMAAMPVSDEEAAMAKAALTERARVEAAHPDRMAQIALVYADFATCLRDGVDRGPKEAIRHVAIGMARADLTELVDFFSGPDYPQFIAASQREEKGETLSAEDKKILAIVETPVMTKFFKSMLQYILEKTMNGKAPEDRDCAGPKATQLAAIGVALAPPPVSTKDDQ